MKKEMEKYFARLFQKYQENGHPYPKAPWNEDVEHFIYQGEPDEDDWIYWKPVEKRKKHDFHVIEEEMGCQLHRSVKEYFNCYWFLSMAGIYQLYSIHLDPVAPGIEPDHFTTNLVGYYSTHQDQLIDTPVGIETNSSMLVVVDNESGKVKLEDFVVISSNEAVSSFKEIAESLEELIEDLSV